MKKSNLVRLIESLTEDAWTSDEAANQGFALISAKGPRIQKFVLYDPTKFLTYIRKAEIYKMVTGKVSHEDASKFILGMIQTENIPENLGKHYGARQVSLSAASKGIGPLMYDIAMTASPNGLVSDRETVSSDAEKIWNYYMNRRRDVSKKPLDDYENPTTPPKEDDGILKPKSRKALNFAYNIQDPTTISRLEDNSDFAIEKAGEILAKRVEEEISNKPQDMDAAIEKAAALLNVAAGQFFNKKYHKL